MEKVAAPTTLALELLGMTEQQWREHNAVAWLILTPRELVIYSGSLEHDANLVPYPTGGEPQMFTVQRRVDGKVVDVELPITVSGDERQATWDEVDALRAKADEQAVAHAGQEFVDEWVSENRADHDGRHLVGGAL